MMMTNFTQDKTKTVAAAFVICAIIVAAAIVYWPRGQVAEAAIIDPHPGLVAWWQFDEGTGSIAKDSSGNGNDAVIYGASWVIGKYGNALSFDGLDDYVDCGSDSAFDITGNITLEAWVKLAPDDWSRSWMPIICKKYPWDSSPWVLRQGGSNVYFTINPVGGSNSINIAASSVITNEWIHVVGTYNGSIGVIYIDGVLKNSAANSFEVDPASGERVYIGGIGSARVQGVVDEVRIYDRALSVTEVKESYQRGPGFSSKLQAKIRQGTTQAIFTLSWQGYGSMNVTIESPSDTYTEDMMTAYQRTTYSTTGDIPQILNIKRLGLSMNALSSDEIWYVILEYDDVEDYQLTVEIQK